MSELIEKYKDFKKQIKPVFICGHYRSGTSLMNHLFDGHPQILANGYETKFFTHFIPLFKKNKINDGLEESLLRIWKDKDEYVKKYFKNINVSEFRETFLKILPSDKVYTPQEYLNACLFTFFLLSDQLDSDKKYWVEKTPHNELFVSEILSFWPNAKFIHLYRDPRDLHATLRRRTDFNFSVRTTIHNWLISYRKMNENKLFFKNNYFITSYEDLVTNPKETMIIISNFLDVNFHESMLTPSFMAGNIEWKGNAVENSYQGISTKSINQWQKYENKKELMIIETALSKEMNILGYKKEFPYKIDIFFISFYHKLVIILKEIRQKFRGEIRGAI
jgi:hypothetical protein